MISNDMCSFIRCVLGASLLTLSLVACGGSGTEPADGGVQSSDADAQDSGPNPDAGLADAGLADSGLADSGTVDGGLADVGMTDASISDANVDAGPVRSQLQLEFTLPDGALLSVDGAIRSRDGDYIVYGSNSSTGVFIARLSIQADVLWAKTYFDSTRSYIAQIQEHPSGDILLAGAHASLNAMLMRLRPDGTPVWRRTFGWEGDDRFENFTIHPDGYIAAGGQSRSLGRLGVPFVVRVNEDGSLRSAFSLAVSPTVNSRWSTIANGPGNDLWVALAAQLGSGDTTPMMIRVTSANTVRTSQEVDWGPAIMDIEAGPTSLTLASSCSVGTTASAWCLADYSHDDTGILTGGNARALPLRPVSITRNAAGEAVYAGRRAANLAAAPRVQRVGPDGSSVFHAQISEASLTLGSFVAGFPEPDFTTVFFDRRFVVARFDASGSAGCLSQPVSDSYRAPVPPEPDSRITQTTNVTPVSAELTDTIADLSLVRYDRCPP